MSRRFTEDGRSRPENTVAPTLTPPKAANRHGSADYRQCLPVVPNVAHPSPKHLKLYAEPPPVVSDPATSFPALPALFDAFRQATGWTLQYTTASSPDAPSTRGKGAKGEGGVPTGLALDLAPAPATAHSIPAKRAQSLASALAQFLGEAIGLEQALWRREAELATAVPLVSGADERQHLAERLEAVLKGGAEAIGCHAAGLYLLDEATSELKLRACWGLPHARLADPARPLRGSVADLEALLGSAVVLENEAMMTPWRAPEHFAAAVCVPVSTATTILGTLWIFSRRPRRFNDRQANLVEIVAGRLAADLEREILLSQGIDAARWQSQLVAAENLQREQLPSTPPQIDGWQMAGWTEQAQSLGGDFFDWICRPDGSTVVTVGDAAGRGLPAALVASALKAALRSHALYPHAPEQVLTQVNQTIWAGSAGDQQGAALLALLRPRDGQITLSTAGPVHAIVLGQNPWDPISNFSPRLGEAPESRFHAREIHLQPGQVAVLFTDGLYETIDEHRHPFGAAGIHDALSAHLSLSPRELAQVIRNRLEQDGRLPLKEDRTVVILKRTDP